MEKGLKAIKKMIKAIAAYENDLTFNLTKCDIEDYDSFTASNTDSEACGNEVLLLGKGHFWLFNDIKLNNEIKGINILKSRIMLRAFVVSPTQVYINDEKIFDEKYWADFRLPEVIISHEYNENDRLKLYIHLENTNEVQATGDPFKVTLFVEEIDDILFNLSTFIHEIEYVRSFEDLVQLHYDLSSFLDQNINEKTNIYDVLDIIQTAREKINPYEHVIKAYTCHLVGHAHIDMNWLWTMEETKDVIRRDFETMTKIMDNNPNFKFSQSQIAVYEIAKEYYPDLYKKIKERVETGNWDITASTYVEADLNMAQGETIARHLLYSKKFVRDEFNRDVLIGWEPDTFGHPASIPQIMKKSNVEYYYHFRCSEGNPLYIWEGNDGSKLLSFSSIYLNPVLPDEIVKISKELKNKYGIKHSLFVYGVGDHGGGPTIRDIRRAEFLDQCPGMPRIQLSKTEDFFQSITEEEQSRLPITKGEQNIIFDGCYTSKADIKKLNRFLENTLYDLEKTAYLGSLYGKVYDQDKVAKLYKHLMFHQFHDILCGCSIHDSYDEAIPILEETLSQASEMLHENMIYLSDLVNTKKETVLVWNLDGFNKNSITTLDVDDEDFILVDEANEEISSAIYNQKLYFKSERVPAMGYKKYYKKQRKESSINTWKIEEDNRTYQINSNYYEIEIDKASGAIVRLFDKENNKSFIEKRDWRDILFNYGSNVFSIEYEAPHDMSAWTIGPITKKEYLIRDANVSVQLDNELMKVIHVKHAVLSSTIHEDIIIYKDFPRIDFDVHVDWNEKGSYQTDAPSLKMSFMPELEGPVSVDYHIPFSTITRENDHIEYPALKWVDVHNNEYGLGIMNDSKYGFSKEGNKINISCIRSSYSPDFEPDVGKHHFKISILPHQGNSKDIDMSKWGQGFSSPSKGVMVKENKPDTPINQSNIKIEAEGVILSCYKKSIDSGELIIRLYEPYGQKDKVKITFPQGIKKVQEVAITEDEILKDILVANNTFEDSFNQYEIKTYKVSLV